MEIINRSPDELIPYANNSRVHSDEQINLICSSILEFGFTNPILVDEKMMVIAGHGRLSAAKRLSMDEVPTIKLTNLTAAQKKAYIIADNKIPLEADWDHSLLKIELMKLDSLEFDIRLIGFDTNLIQTIDFRPSIDPAMGSASVSDENLEKKKDELESIYKAEAEKGVEVICPHCLKEFNYVS